MTRAVLLALALLPAAASGGVAAKWGLALPVFEGLTEGPERLTGDAALGITEVRAAGNGREARLEITRGLGDAGGKAFVSGKVKEIFDLYSRKFRGGLGFDRKPCQPKKEKRGEGVLVEGLANAKGEFGACGKDPGARPLFAIFLLCPERGLAIELRHFPAKGDEAHSVKEKLWATGCGAAGK